MCFDLSYNTIFFSIFIQIWLLQRIIMVSNSKSSGPEISFRSHIASQLAEQDAMYSTSAVMRETLDYFLLNHEIMADPRQ